MILPGHDSAAAGLRASAVKIPALKHGDQAEVAAKFLALFNDAQAVMPRVLAFGVYAHNHKLTELKHGQFLPWLRAICPADRPPESFIRCVQSHLRLTESVLKAAGIKIRNAFRICHGGELFLLPAADVPAASQPVREKVFDIIDGKSARQLFLEFKQADDDEENPKPKRGRLKGQGGASAAQRAAHQSKIETKELLEIVTAAENTRDWLDEVTDEQRLGRIHEVEGGELARKNLLAAMEHAVAFLRRKHK